MEKIKDIFYKYWRVMVIIIAVIYIGLGVYQLITGNELDEKTLKTVSGTLMFLALIIFLYGKNMERIEMQKEKQAKELEEKEEVKED